MSDHVLQYISVKDRLPEEYLMCFLMWTYANGNMGLAVGYIDNGEWEIEWSDDHPTSEDISHWIEGA